MSTKITDVKLFAQSNKYLLLFHVTPSFLTLCYKSEIHTTLELVRHERYTEVAQVIFIQGVLGGMCQISGECSLC